MKKSSPKKKANALGVRKAAAIEAAPTEPKKTVLVLRTCNADGTSHGGFRWPLDVGAAVEAPDWRDDTTCGGGLHGWLWGSGNWKLKSKDANRVWMVLAVDELSIRDLDGKVKFPRCTVAYISNDWASAMGFIRGAAAYIERFAAEEIATATGNSGHASATGDYGHASATGNSGHASATGYSGHASATGYSGHASATGDSGNASATGYSGHASATGDSGCAVAVGIESRVRCGANGFIAAAWLDSKGRLRLLVGYAGEDGIEARRWYRVCVFGETAKFVKDIEP